RRSSVGLFSNERNSTMEVIAKAAPTGNLYGDEVPRFIKVREPSDAKVQDRKRVLSDVHHTRSLRPLERSGGIGYPSPRYTPHPNRPTAILTALPDKSPAQTPPSFHADY
ncbi:hypothetical protein, partial [Caballeronia sp. BR00000012568055]|uniref:hypothetical protein n=1 Tax=Caballeronia sp. BR00000012568055 TaxID=2918761 RepID=UPI0023F960A1